MSEIKNNHKVKKSLHISIDDFSEGFKDITINEDKYSSIFDNKVFALLKKLHNNFGVVISCYCFNSFSGFDLNKATEKFQKDFADNSDWLKFGFHGSGSYNYSCTTSEQAINDYSTFTNSLISITGGSKSIERVIRLENFAGNIESVQAMANCENGIKGLLIADDNRKSYYLSEEACNQVRNHDVVYDDRLKISFYPSKTRLENVENIKQFMCAIDTKKNLKKINIFTHEWLLFDDKVYNNLIKCCEYAFEKKYEFSYLINN